LSSIATFRSFLLGGFECSTHRRPDGHCLDLLAATAHDLLAQADYRELARHDIRSARDGLRWHLIETAPGQYDWSSFLPLLNAANSVGTQVIWDLCHYGWPPTRSRSGPGPAVTREGSIPARSAAAQSSNVS